MSIEELITSAQQTLSTCREDDPRGAIAAYVLDLHRQRYDLQGIVAKLKATRAVAWENQEYNYSDSIDALTRKIKRDKS